LDWIVFGKGSQISQIEQTQTALIPIVGRAAGDDSGGQIVFDEHTVLIEEDVTEYGTAANHLRIPRQVRAVQVGGHSMDPIVWPGQYVLIDCGHRSPFNGDLVVIETVDGRTLFKRYHEIDDRIALASQKENEPLVPLQPEKIAHCHVVVGVWYG